jgi:predicted dehydrogenase
MKARLRLGILGTGIAARRLYLPALRQLDCRIDLVACANLHRRKAEDYARLAKIPKVVDNAEQLLALPEVQAVLISLPIAAQPEYVIMALAQGKAVLSEKPVGPSVVAGKRLIRAAARYRCPWMVGENLEFMPQARKLMAWIKQGRLGNLRTVQVTQIAKMDRHNPYFHTAWRQQPEFIGGFVLDAGVHLAHIVRRCVGMPKVVKNITAQFDPALLPIDTAVAALEFDSGVVGTWTSCFSSHYRGPILRVFGDRGYAELDWNKVTLRNAKGKESVFQSSVSSFHAQFSHFADVVLKRKPIAVTPEDALQDLAFMEGIVKRRGR